MADVFGTTVAAIGLAREVISLFRRYQGAQSALEDYKKKCKTTLSSLELFKEILAERAPLLSRVPLGKKIQDGCNETVQRVNETLKEFRKKLESLPSGKKISATAAADDARGRRKDASGTGKSRPLGVVGRGKVVWSEKELDEFVDKLIQGSHELNQWIGVLQAVHLEKVDGTLDKIDGGIKKLDAGIDRLLQNLHQDPGDQSQSEALLAAIKSKDANRVQEVLQRGGIRVDAKLDPDDNTALHLAASSGLCDVIDVLLDHNAQALVYNKSGETPLELALLSRHQQAAGDIIAKRQEASHRLNKNQQRTPLHLAAEMGFLAVVQTLLNYGVRADCRDDRGWTPLHGAVAAKPLNLELVEQLVRSYNAAGFAAATRSSNATVLHMLADREQSDTALKALKLVLDAADGRALNSRLKSGQTPLYIAACKDHDKAAEILLDHGAEMDLICEAEADAPTALWASMVAKESPVSRCLDTAELLLKRGADSNTTAKDGNTLLHLAVKVNSERRIHLLVRHNPKLLNIKNKKGETPLENAVKMDRYPLVVLLLQLGAQADGADADQTPFMHAASQGNLRMLRVLREYGASWSRRTQAEGADAFVLAVNNYHVACAGYLLGLGRRVNRATPEGYTALHFAARNGALEPVRWLVELNAGLRLRATKLAGDFKAVGTAAEVARAHGHDEVAGFLEDQLPPTSEDGEERSIACIYLYMP